MDGPASRFFVRPTGGLASLQQPYFDIASAGWQQRLGENTLLSLELLARDGHHELVYETESPGHIGSNFACIGYWPPYPSAGYAAPDYYNLYRADQANPVMTNLRGEFLGSANFLTANALQYIAYDTGLAASTSYTYTLKAVISGVESAASPAITITTLQGPVSIASPPNLPATVASSASG